jgi:hypothetical protein
MHPDAAVIQACGRSGREDALARRTTAATTRDHAPSEATAGQPQPSDYNPLMATTHPAMPARKPRANTC